MLAISATLAIGLLVWFGLDPVVSRLSTLWTGEAYSSKSGRVFLLFHAWPVFADFPWLGTGYGTFRFIEPLWFHTPETVGSIYRHAHNDYLEDLMEGGIVRLGLRLVAIATLVRFALRGLGNARGTLRPQVIGLVFAVTTIVIHSFFEFGLHLPAIAALSTVVAAHLCSASDRSLTQDAIETGIGRPNGIERRPAVKRESASETGFGGIAPVGFSVTAVLLAWVLYTEGVRGASVESLRQEAQAMRELAFAGEFGRESEIPFLEAALQLQPNDAELNVLLAEAHFGVHNDSSGSAELRPVSHGTSDSLATALQHSIRARALCPILPTPHARLAAHVKRFTSSDSTADYLNRAKFLAPADARLWYFCGMQEFAESRMDDAQAVGGRSLELSDHHLAEILDRVAISFRQSEILNILRTIHNSFWRQACICSHTGTQLIYDAHFRTRIEDLGSTAGAVVGRRLAYASSVTCSA